METVRITKNAGNVTCESGTPSENELELISRYTRKKPEAKDIYTFTVTLCDNEVDRDCERFSIDALNILKNMFEGVTGIFDHSMKSCDQTARIYRTEVVTDSCTVTSCGEPYTRLKAWCYMLRNDKNADLISEIDNGIKKEVSISCSVSKTVCSICGKDIRRHECNHIKGENINGKICHAVHTVPTDAYEWSFVAVPAQRNAGVSKSAKLEKDSLTTDLTDPSEIIKSLSSLSSQDSVTLSNAQFKSIASYINSIRADADTVKERRIQTEKEIIALSAFTLPDADTEMLKAILKKLDSKEILMFRKAFSDKAKAVGSFTPEFMDKNDKNSVDNSQFKI